MVVDGLPKIGGSANYNSVICISGRRVTSVFVHAPKIHNLIFDLIDHPISNTMWRAIHNALI